MSRTVSCELSNSTVTEVFPPNHVAATVYTRDSPSGAHLDVINKVKNGRGLSSTQRVMRRSARKVQFDEILAGFKNMYQVSFHLPLLSNDIYCVLVR